MLFELPLINVKPVSLQYILRQVLEELMPLVDEKNLDLGFITESDAVIVDSEKDLIFLVKTLLKNAISNTPQNGKIDISHITDSEEIIMKVVVH